MSFAIMSLVGTALAAAYAVFATGFYLNLKRSLNYSLARLFLKGSSVHALILLVLSLIFFTLARIISFTIIVGALGEETILFVRAPLDLVATALLLVSVAILYVVTKRSEIYPS